MGRYILGFLNIYTLWSAIFRRESEMVSEIEGYSRDVKKQNEGNNLNPALWE